MHAELTRTLQTELHRVGCYSGGIDGALGPGTVAAIQRFNQRAGKRLDTQIASPESVTTVREHSDRVCVAPPPVRRRLPEDEIPPARGSEAPSRPISPAPPQSKDCFTFNGQHVCQ